MYFVVIPFFFDNQNKGHKWLSHDVHIHLSLCLCLSPPILFVSTLFQRKPYFQFFCLFLMAQAIHNKIWCKGEKNMTHYHTQHTNTQTHKHYTQPLSQGKKKKRRNAKFFCFQFKKFPSDQLCCVGKSPKISTFTDFSFFPFLTHISLQPDLFFFFLYRLRSLMKSAATSSMLSQTLCTSGSWMHMGG